MVAAGLDLPVRQRAAWRCEYCREPEQAGSLRHTLDHVIARQHGGTDASSNLALCCLRCNLSKGPNLSGIDPESRAITRLFNPRSDVWEQHFRYDGVMLNGLSAEGRTTVVVLKINHEVRVTSRVALIAMGIPLS